MHRSSNKTLDLACSLRKRDLEGSTMTMAKLLQICKENGAPSNPLAVTRLELHCQLFTEINECISAFRDVTQLLLNQNKISRICCLEQLTQLKCLYLQNNRLTRLEGLSALLALRILDVSHNALTRLEGLGSLPVLETLLVTDNQLCDEASMSHLLDCGSLAELDVSHNRISDLGVLPRVFARMPRLQTLTLQYNPLSNAADPGNTEPPLLPNYRRTVISLCSGLTALDHRPVFPQERAYAEAWWAATADAAAAAASGSQHAASTPSEPSPLSPAAPLSPFPAMSSSQPTRPVPLISPEANVTVAGSCSSFSPSPSATPLPSPGPQRTTTSSAPFNGVLSPSPSPRGASTSQPPVPADPSVTSSLLLDGELPSAVLQPVLACLGSRALVMACLTCRWWAHVTAERLWEVRFRAAQARLSAAQPAWAECPSLLSGVSRHQMRELMAVASPPRPLAQLMWALRLLWIKRRRGAPGDGEGMAALGGDGGQAAKGDGGHAGTGSWEQAVTGDGGQAATDRGGQGCNGSGDGCQGAGGSGMAGEQAEAGVQVCSPGGGDCSGARRSLGTAGEDAQARAQGRGREHRGREGGHGSVEGQEGEPQREGEMRQPVRQTGGGLVSSNLEHGVRHVGVDPLEEEVEEGEEEEEAESEPGACFAEGCMRDAGAPGTEQGTEPAAGLSLNAETGSESASNRDLGEDIVPDMDPLEAAELQHADSTRTVSSQAPDSDPDLEDLDLAANPESDAAVPEELRQHFDSRTWIAQAWAQCLPMAGHRRFPRDLQRALPLDPRTVARLRARTGAADDLEVYTPLLDPVEVSRCHAACGSLCRWLLAVLEHEYARQQVDEARGWGWPQRVRQGWVLKGQQHWPPAQ